MLVHHHLSASSVSVQAVFSTSYSDTDSVSGTVSCSFVMVHVCVHGYLCQNVNATNILRTDERIASLPVLSVFMCCRCAPDILCRCPLSSVCHKDESFSYVGWLCLI